ncbi:MAG: XRE family transcriptional regulator [Lactobacillus sp.]|nr:MAG: XRE family transcriptional regulator [Lactobacillus sp.]
MASTVHKNLNKNKDTLSLNIKELRLKLGMTLEQFGQQLTPPVSKGLVYGWEHGKSSPNIRNLSQLVALSGESMADFTYGPLDKFLYQYFLEEILENEPYIDDSMDRAKKLASIAVKLVRDGDYNDPRLDANASLFAIESHARKIADKSISNDDPSNLLGSSVNFLQTEILRIVSYKAGLPISNTTERNRADKLLDVYSRAFNELKSLSPND